MKVALNLVYLVPGETGGMETYARELIPRLADIDGVDLLCIVNRETWGSPGPWGEACECVLAPVKATNRVEWVAGEQLHVPRIASAAGSTLVHSLASTSPLWGPQVRVTTIHDLNFMMIPDAHFGVRGVGMRILVPAAARRSSRIIVDASSTKEDLEMQLGVDPSKVDVVPLGVSPPGEFPADPPPELTEVQSTGRPIVLIPGAKRPHKNAVTAFAALALMGEAERPQLVITGYSTPYEVQLMEEARARGVEDFVTITDNLSAEGMEALYSAASVVAVVSRYEGFGLPILEAMQRGVPVVASDRSSLPEVAGGAALLVDPDSASSVAGALSILLRDPEAAKRAREAGLLRAADFTWDRTALMTATSYERALGASA